MLIESLSSYRQDRLQKKLGSLSGGYAITLFGRKTCITEGSKIGDTIGPSPHFVIQAEPLTPPCTLISKPKACLIGDRFACKLSYPAVEAFFSL